MYHNFDLVDTRDHVLYADALGGYPLKDIEEHYLNLVKFHALKRVLDEGWQFRDAATSENILKHLEKYVQKIKDTRFRQCLVTAVEEYFAHRPDDGSIEYETRLFAVSHVPHFAENRYGFHFKDTDEFGLYTLFVDDRNKAYRGFYRSDRQFEAEIDLNYLRIDERI